MLAQRFFNTFRMIGLSCVALGTLLAAMGVRQTTATPPRCFFGPDSMVLSEVPQGTIEAFEHLQSNVFPGTQCRYYVYVPQQYDASAPAALMVFLNGHTYVSHTGDYRAPVVMDNLIHQGHIPATIGVFVEWPHQKNERSTKLEGQQDPEDGHVDLGNDSYARLVIDEILPKVQSKYKITQDSSGRGIAGCRSGGVGAFNIAWQRPDQFSKVVSHIERFGGTHHGVDYPAIVRKTEKKAMRVYLQNGANDSGSARGNGRLANKQMEKALSSKGYDVKFEFGGGVDGGNHGGAILPDALRWLWRDYPGVQTLSESLIAKPNREAWAARWWWKRHREKLLQKDRMKRVDMVMIGDSITHHFEERAAPVWNEYFKPLNTLNLGFSGDRTEHVLWRLRNGAVEGLTPKLVTLMIGTNNTGHRSEPPEETADGIKEILRELKFRLPQSKILLLGIFPRDERADGKKRRQNEQINSIIKNFGDGETVFYLDIGDQFLEKDRTLPRSIMPDALHPNAAGYKIWAEAIMPRVRKFLE